MSLCSRSIPSRYYLYFKYISTYNFHNILIILRLFPSTFSYKQTLNSNTLTSVHFFGHSMPQRRVGKLSCHRHYLCNHRIHCIRLLFDFVANEVINTGQKEFLDWSALFFFSNLKLKFDLSTQCTKDGSKVKYL